MPQEFKTLGMGNGFNFCPKRLSQPESFDAEFYAAKNFTLEEAMSVYWNMHGISFSGEIGVDYRDFLFYNRNIEFSTEFEATQTDAYGYATKQKIFAGSSFAEEPRSRESGDFLMHDDANYTILQIKGPYLNDVGCDISSQNIFGAVYAFKILFSISSMGEIYASTKRPGSGYLLRQTAQTSFLGRAIPLYVSTRFNEYITPDYRFSITPITAKIYTAADY